MTTESTKVDINFLIENVCKEIRSILNNLRGRL